MNRLFCIDRHSKEVSNNRKKFRFSWNKHFNYRKSKKKTLSIDCRVVLAATLSKVKCVNKEKEKNKNKIRRQKTVNMIPKIEIEETHSTNLCNFIQFESKNNNNNIKKEKLKTIWCLSRKVLWHIWMHVHVHVAQDEH